MFFVSFTSLSGFKFKNYFISNNGKPTTNYKSIHFIIDGKELNEEETQTIILSDIDENDKGKLKSNFHIKVVLNHPITPIIHFPIFYFRLTISFGNIK